MSTDQLHWNSEIDDLCDRMDVKMKTIEYNYDILISIEFDANEYLKTLSEEAETGVNLKELVTFFKKVLEYKKDLHNCVFNEWNPEIFDYPGNSLVIIANTKTIIEGIETIFLHSSEWKYNNLPLIIEIIKMIIENCSNVRKMLNIVMSNV